MLKSSFRSVNYENTILVTGKFACVGQHWCKTISYYIYLQEVMVTVAIQTRSSCTTRTEISGTQSEQWTQLGQSMEWAWSMWMILVLAVSEQISWKICHKFGTLWNEIFNNQTLLYYILIGIWLKNIFWKHYSWREHLMEFFVDSTMTYLPILIIDQSPKDISLEVKHWFRLLIT